MKEITIFTPTYNREKTLTRLYLSLVKQNYKNFEWLIIDDGSTDNTKSLIQSFIEENKINIRYFRTQNGGKHRAINKALDMALGRLFFIVDSDDYLQEDALNKIIKWESTINSDSNIAGVVGLKAYSIDEIVGTTFEGEYKDLLIYDREKNNISGDRAEIFYTEILKKYKFPEYESENFAPEALIWNKMAFDGYMLRYFNEIIYMCEYLEDGLTKNIEKKYRENPKSFLEYIKQLLSINKHNLLNRIRYVSYYQYIFDGIYTNKKICKDLNVSLIFLEFSVFLRKCKNILKRV